MAPLIPISELDAATAAALDIEIDAGGNVKRRFWNKGAAAQMAMKHLGLFKEDNSQNQKGANLALQVVLVQPKPRLIEDD